LKIQKVGIERGGFGVSPPENPKRWNRKGDFGGSPPKIQKVGIEGGSFPTKQRKHRIKRKVCGGGGLPPESKKFGWKENLRGLPPKK